MMCGCARSGRGQQTTAAPSRVINFRRFIRSPTGVVVRRILKAHEKDQRWLLHRNGDSVAGHLALALPLPERFGIAQCVTLWHIGWPEYLRRTLETAGTIARTKLPVAADRGRDTNEQRLKR